MLLLLVDCRLDERGDDAVTHFCQSTGELLLKLFVKLVPTRTVVEERPLVWRRFTFHNSLRSSRAKLPQRYSHVVGLQVGRVQQAGQLQQRGHGSARFISRSQLTTAIGIGHPSGNEYPAIVGLQFKLQRLACPKESRNGQPATMEGMKGVVNRDDARIAGIVVEFLQPSRLWATVTLRSHPRQALDHQAYPLW